jgi:tocopherol cyclase
MFATLRRTMHPEGYHGTTRRSPYFEGWYFKIVDAEERHAYAVIPGISLAEGDGAPRSGSHSGAHSFVQVLNGTTGATIYRRYPVAAFTAAERTLDVRVGPNHFTWDGMYLDLSGTDLPLKGTIDFIDPQPWPITVISPGIMDWFSWVPLMQCYHGVLSFDHGLKGNLQTGSGATDFDGGRGYIEKDWGRAFPSGWVWMQSNHFTSAGTCLTASIARIPWIGTTFSGFIVGLLWKGKLYRFATYTGARTIRLNIEENTVHWVIEDTRYRLTLTARRSRTGNLRGPSKTDMGRPVPETLSATVGVELTTRAGEVIFSETGRCSGMEIGGNTQTLIN